MFHPTGLSTSGLDGSCEPASQHTLRHTGTWSCLLLLDFRGEPSAVSSRSVLKVIHAACLSPTATCSTSVPIFEDAGVSIFTTQIWGPACQILHITGTVHICVPIVLGLEDENVSFPVTGTQPQSLYCYITSPFEHLAPSEKHEKRQCPRISTPVCTLYSLGSIPQVVPTTYPWHATEQPSDQG